MHNLTNRGGAAAFRRARLEVETGVSRSRHRYAGEHGDVLSVERSGAFDSGGAVMCEFGFTVDDVYMRVLAHLRHKS